MTTSLTEDGLVLALVAEVAREALAEAVRVVADAAARAIAALLVTVTKEDVGARRALLERAVGAAEAQVAHAAHVLHGIPRRVVSLVRLDGELLLRVADPPTGAVVRADCSLARDAVVVLEALALARVAVAEALVRALNLRVRLIRGRGHRHPRRGLGAGAGRAVVLREGKVAVRAEVARAFVVGAARAVARAPVGAVRVTKSSEGGNGENAKSPFCSSVRPPMKPRGSQNLILGAQMPCTPSKGSWSSLPGTPPRM